MGFNNKRSKFKEGDKVEVVRYGHLYWSYEKEPIKHIDYDPVVKCYLYDMSPELVGQKGVVTEVTKTQGKYQYSLSGLSKSSWYDEKQLKAVLPAPKSEKLRRCNPRKK
jgi:hypothetical protein